MHLTTEELFTALSKHLPNLTKKDIEDFMSITTYKKVEKSKIILKNGLQTKKVFLILKGTVRGYIIDKKGHEITILIRSSGIFVADTGTLFTSEPQRMAFKSIEETHILLFNYKDFELLANENPRIMHLHLQSLKEAITRLFYRIETLTTMTPEERYKDVLELNPDFIKTTNAKFLANFLGITPQSLSRIMKRIKNNRS
ncbi:MAG: Crp/Fnr family transcriptional regulator [Flavobacteriaceae bacterium]|nr:Crp/Fnr family transcriptional regulator [Flavobacteriaceae bacterium]